MTKYPNYFFRTLSKGNFVENRTMLKSSVVIIGVDDMPTIFEAVVVVEVDVAFTPVSEM